MNQDFSGYFPVDVFGEIISQDAVAFGMSGATVRSVTTTKGSYVVRIYRGDHDTWQRSLNIHRLVANGGIAPPLLHVDTERQATVSQKISGISFGSAVSKPLTQQAALLSLTATLAKLHALPVHQLPRNSPLTFAHEVWAAQCQRPGFPDWAVPLAARLNGLEEIIALDDRRVLAHGDLNPSNILWDGTRVWFVDWDGAGLCHPYLDMATIANFLSLPDETAAALLAMQERSELSSAQQELFGAYRGLVRIVYGSVFLRMVPDLSQVAFASLASTPTLQQCFSRMVAGELNMASMEDQAQIGAAFFKQCE